LRVVRDINQGDKKFIKSTERHYCNNFSIVPEVFDVRHPAVVPVVESREEGDFFKVQIPRRQE
jgi:hypothetical protein